MPQPYLKCLRYSRGTRKTEVQYFENEKLVEVDVAA